MVCHSRFRNSRNYIWLHCVIWLPVATWEENSAHRAEYTTGLWYPNLYRPSDDIHFQIGEKTISWSTNLCEPRDVKFGEKLWRCSLCRFCCHGNTSTEKWTNWEHVFRCWVGDNAAKVSTGLRGLGFREGRWRTSLSEFNRRRQMRIWEETAFARKPLVTGRLFNQHCWLRFLIVSEISVYF